jgi:hypothetical protein
MDTCQNFFIVRSFRSLSDFPAIKPNHWVLRTPLSLAPHGGLLDAEH